MTPCRAHSSQGNLLLAVGCALSSSLWLLPSAAATATSASAVAVGPEEACVDDNAKWATHNSTCAEMKWLCNNEGYGMLVRKWCPRTCGLCQPPSRLVLEDAVAFIAERHTPVVASSLEKISVARKQHHNVTGKVVGVDLLRPTGQFMDSASSSPNASWNASITPEANQTNATEVLHHQTAMKWEITLPFKDALVHVLSKVALVPRALWSADQEHFVFEVSNSSQNASDNVSARSVERDLASKTKALQEDEESQCPAGYTQVMGHVYGGDQFGKGYNLFAANIRECARWCSHTAGCGSFDYSRSSKRCFRNSQTRPTSLWDRKGFLLCRRAPCPSLLTEADCLGPAVSPGWLSAEVRLRPGSYCIWSAGKCQAPMACTFEDCFLPDGGLPGMELPLSKTLWISRSGLMSTMEQSKPF